MFRLTQPNMAFPKNKEFILDKLIVASNQTLTDIIDGSLESGKYCSFRSYYAHILTEVEDSENINESLYFKALVKKGVVIKGYDGKYRDSYFPPEEVMEVMDENNLECHSVYRRKKKVGTDKTHLSFGFNCEDVATLNSTVGLPVVTLLNKVAKGIAEAKLVTDKQKDALKAARLPVEGLSSHQAEAKVIKKLLEV